MKRADDRSPGEPLPFESPAINDAVVVHPDGETVAMAAGNDIWVVPAGGELLQFTDNPAIEVAPRFSPDGRWLAYVSNEQGSDHVYAQAFPGPGRRWLVSPRGGFEPVWAPDGRRLLFREGLGFFAVAVDSAATSPFGLPEALFEANVVRGAWGAANYDVAADGRLVVVATDLDLTDVMQLNVVLNFASELEQLVPTGR